MYHPLRKGNKETLPAIRKSERVRAKGKVAIMNN